MKKILLMVLYAMICTTLFSQTEDSKRANFQFNQKLNNWGEILVYY
jgi:hypothetical protein